MKVIIDTNGLEINKSLFEMFLEKELGHPITIKDVPNIDVICEWFCINQVDNGVKWDNAEKNSEELRKLLKNID